MRLRRLSFLIALFAALVLPLQAMAGIVMAVGMADDDGVMITASAADLEAMPEDCPMHHQQSAPDTAHCGHCGICHLAATGFVDPAASGSAVLPVVETYAASFIPVPASHIPEPPQHPPRRSV